MQKSMKVEASPRCQQREAEVIYQIYPASFADANADGWGDLPGITSKLDYLQFLGVDAIWLSPIYPSPEGPTGDGGYAVNDRRSIDPRYGTQADFTDLVQGAHARGLRVYLDDVMPHTSDEHPWFAASRARDPDFTDFYIWADSQDVNGQRQPPNNWMSVFGGGGWEWDEQRGQYYFHHFLTSQPALNLNNAKVQKAVLADMKFWLDQGLDGFRYDSLSYANYDPQLRSNPALPGNDGQHWEGQLFQHSHCQPQTIELVGEIRQLMDSYANKKTTLGEVICGREGGRNPMSVAATYVDPKHGLDMCYTDMFRAINHRTDHGYLQGVINSLFTHFPHGGHCNAIGNHDSPRLASRNTEHIPEHYKLPALQQLWRLMAVLPGSLSIYQGEELGLPDARIGEDIPPHRLRDPVAQTKGMEFCRDGARTPMPWHSGRANAGFSDHADAYLPVPDDHYHRAVNKQSQNPGSMLHFVRSLIDWRRHQPALRHGHGYVLDTRAPLIAILRESQEQSLLAIFNMSAEQVMFKPSDLLNSTQVQQLGLSREEVIRLSPYDSDFRGAHVFNPHPARHSYQRLEI